MMSGCDFRNPNLVNRELDDLKALLSGDAAPKVLKPGGRLVVISFHSLEDRIVKDAMREGASNGIYRVLTKKPVTAGDQEVESNPRRAARSCERRKKFGTNKRFRDGIASLNTRAKFGVPQLSHLFRAVPEN